MGLLKLWGMTSIDRLQRLAAFTERLVWSRSVQSTSLMIRLLRDERRAKEQKLQNYFFNKDDKVTSSNTELTDFCLHIHVSLFVVLIISLTCIPTLHHLLFISAALPESSRTVCQLLVSCIPVRPPRHTGSVCSSNPNISAVWQTLSLFHKWNKTLLNRFYFYIYCST